MIFEDTLTVSFKFKGHKSREEATQTFEKRKKENTSRAQIQVILPSWYFIIEEVRQDEMKETGTSVETRVLFLSGQNTTVCATIAGHLLS